MSKEKRRSKCLWLLVSHDKYELPLLITDTADEMANIIGVSKATINSAIKHAEDYGGWCKYVRVKLSEEDVKELKKEDKL